ncbi:MAG: hypothetical protein CMJ34_05145 [Phycisphaerae bacterium]|nr:hypothetical protein [Phycisphaerae bacterium]
MKVPSDQFPERADRSSEPLYRLPAGLLGVGWLVSALLGVGGWFVISGVVELPPDWLNWGVIGGVISSVIGGLGLLIIGPWKPRRSGDLPTLWLASTTGRLLAIPGVAFVIYSAARPPDRPFVIGLAASALLLLMIEVPIIAKSMLAQIEEDEARGSREGG